MNENRVAEGKDGQGMMKLTKRRYMKNEQSKEERKTSTPPHLKQNELKGLNTRTVKEGNTRNTAKIKQGVNVWNSELLDMEQKNLYHAGKYADKKEERNRGINRQ